MSKQALTEHDHTAAAAAEQQGHAFRQLLRRVAALEAAVAALHSKPIPVPPAHLPDEGTTITEVRRIPAQLDEVELDKLFEATLRAHGRAIKITARGGVSEATFERELRGEFGAALRFIKACKRLPAVDKTRNARDWSIACEGWYHDRREHGTRTTVWGFLLAAFAAGIPVEMGNNHPFNTYVALVPNPDSGGWSMIGNRAGA